MKKLFFLSIFMLCALATRAQYYPDGRPIPPSKRAAYYHQNRHPSDNYRSGLQTYYGFRVGLGVSSVHSDATDLDGSDAKTGLNAGVVLGTQLTTAAPLFFETGLYYTEKGGKGHHDWSKFTYNLDYLELPLLIKYKYYVNPDFSIEPFMGGYVACGVAGKVKDYGNREAYSSFDNDETNNFKRFDGGLKLGCGFGFQMFYIGLSYDIGLANIGHDDFDETKNGCFNLDFGINF
jgi:hypothetical protein